MPASTPAQPPSLTNLPLDPQAPKDFDFFFGDWHVKHRRLKGRLVGSTTWETFDGRCVCHPILGGYGNVDDNLLELPGGTYRAATFRSFDAATKRWSIWWLDARTPGALDVPVVGHFDEQGVGTFIAHDTLEGRPIVVRFTWSKGEGGEPCWEQAFSPDGGQTWETNWVMRFTRFTCASA